MSLNDRNGTFWVIDGVRVKKKKPFFVTEVPRTLKIHENKIERNQTPIIITHEPQLLL